MVSGFGFRVIAFMLGLFWGCLGITEKKMETFIVGYIGFRIILGLDRDTGK